MSVGWPYLPPKRHEVYILHFIFISEIAPISIEFTMQKPDIAAKSPHFQQGNTPAVMVCHDLFQGRPALRRSAKVPWRSVLQVQRC